MKFSPFLHRARITLRRNILHFGVYCAAVYTNLAVILRDHKQAAAVIFYRHYYLLAFFIIFLFFSFEYVVYITARHTNNNPK